ncbi:unnamed protein product, partial [Allacma fusca]
VLMLRISFKVITCNGPVCALLDPNVFLETPPMEVTTIATKLILIDYELIYHQYNQSCYDCRSLGNTTLPRTEPN